MIRAFFFLLFTFLLSGSIFSQKQPVELGDVHWVRDYDQALRQSEQLGKPVLILFQEIPGCATCQRFGQEVLSHPLLVEAIEQFFVPLAIYNNRPGKDAEVLQMFQEPAWNNPVVRIVDLQGRNLTGRVAGNYTPGAVADAMIQVLERQKKDIPGYLGLLRDEFSTSKPVTKTYQMYCFWSGEKLLGGTPGVLKTRAGYQQGHEVVQVTYDPSQLQEKELDGVAQAGSCKPVTGGSFRDDREPKYYITNSQYRFIPMTEMQASRINSLLGQGKDPQAWLSPLQRAWLQDIQLHPNKGWKSWVQQDWVKGWKVMTETEW
ncbi:MAG: VPGUxxT family thioredoxin-like (seleno)protein, type 2 [Saprospiraceae bacterium]